MRRRHNARAARGGQWVDPARGRLMQTQRQPQLLLLGRPNDVPRASNSATTSFSCASRSPVSSSCPRSTFQRRQAPDDERLLNEYLPCVGRQRHPLAAELIHTTPLHSCRSDYVARVDLSFAKCFMGRTLPSLESILPQLLSGFDPPLTSIISLSRLYTTGRRLCRALFSFLPFPTIRLPLAFILKPRPALTGSYRRSVSTTTATACDSLGTSGLSRALNEPECAGLFADAELLPTSLPVLPNTPTVKYIISHGKPDPKMLASLTEVRQDIKVLSIEDLRTRGAALPMSKRQLHHVHVRLNRHARGPGRLRQRAHAPRAPPHRGGHILRVPPSETIRKGVLAQVAAGGALRRLVFRAAVEAKRRWIPDSVVLSGARGDGRTSLTVLPNTPTVKYITFHGKPDPKTLASLTVTEARQDIGVLSIEDLRTRGAALPMSLIEGRRPTPSSVSCTMYTSGSTGTHTNLVAFVGSVHTRLGHHLTAEDTYFAYLPARRSGRASWRRSLRAARCGGSCSAPRSRRSGGVDPGQLGIERTQDTGMTNRVVRHVRAPAARLRPPRRRIRRATGPLSRDQGLYRLSLTCPRAAGLGEHARAGRSLHSCQRALGRFWVSQASINADPTNFPGDVGQWNRDGTFTLIDQPDMLDLNIPGVIRFEESTRLERWVKCGHSRRRQALSEAVGQVAAGGELLPVQTQRALQLSLLRSSTTRAAIITCNYSLKPTIKPIGMSDTVHPTGTGFKCGQLH
ncbi:hypothetical protein GGX14DRAFT_387251 [Mycena pura]|uniref:AMP-dependent synthetase/ligase domain-containing protein n=1 Tax=Mycena pura TaxID=153505 RepID=A0AAD7E357_9AGAR|nr:hypothetical protein GGX14DRAFT_387251 [Mycena pura]